MSKTLGQSIGKISHSFNVTNHSKQKTSLTVTFDFTTASDVDIKQWLTAERTIAWQKPARMLSLEELNELNGTTVLAQDCSKKRVSREERIAQFENSGMPHDVAVIAVDNPELFASIMKKASADITTDDETSDDE